MRHFLRLWPFIRPFRKYLFGSVVLAFPLAALRAGPAPLVKTLVDRLFVSKNEEELIYYPLAFIGIYALNFAVRFFHYYWHRAVIIRVNESLKNRIFEHLMGLSSEYFTEKSTGQLISRVNSDPSFIDAGLLSLQTLVREPITFIMLFIYCCYLNWQLTVLTFLVFPPLAWVFSASGRNLRRYILSMTEENAKLFSTLQESVSGNRMVKTFGLEGYVGNRFRSQSRRYAEIMSKTSMLEEFSHPLVEFLTAVLIAGVIYLGGSQIIHGSITPGDLLAFFTAFALMIHPLRLLNDVSLKVFAADTAAKRIFEILDWKSRLKESPHPRGFEGLQEGIEFEKVRFAYPDQTDREILRGISFSVKKGKVVALVGPSGAGKSSLVTLVPRLFDVTAGQIRIDGVDIREYRLESLRAKIAVVSQDVFLFNDTILENIRCGKLSATEVEIRVAAQKAHALDFIDRLPQGFQTVIGDRGTKLSGGERQRVSIARAFLRDAPLLILDEATSSLDNASERAVQEALDELMKNKTTLVIAHRLSTIRYVDRIYVLKEGMIVEEGTHEELVGHAGEYRKLYELGQSQ